MDTEHYTNTNIFQGAQTIQNILQPAPGEEAVSGKNLKWVLGVGRMCQIALVSYYGWFLGCACCVMLTSSTSGRYRPALEQPFHAAGWMERRMWLSEGLETSLEKLLRWCSVLLQSLLPDFVKIGCSNMSVLHQTYQCLVPLKGLLNLRPGWGLAFLARSGGAWQVHVVPCPALCDHNSWSFRKILI